MLFNSALFLFFFGAVAGLVWATPARLRWCVLLIASIVFYASWDYRYLPVVFWVAAVGYAYGRFGVRLDGASGHRMISLAIVLILLPLVFFKYANFLVGNLAPVFAAVGLTTPRPLTGVVLPLGISFYTFQILSYCLDVRAGRYKPREGIGKLVLYPLYFPHQVAGPIMRPAGLLPQFDAPATPEYEALISGFRLFIWGLFKKVFVADRLAVFVDTVYGAPGQHRGLACVLAVYFFAFQIYCDFSGYTDMALGISRMLGIELCENFRRPYFSASLREFWSRWHISLSTWMRDYLYIPLGGNRVGPGRWTVNILGVFALSGLWHGASWTFVLWGLFHGAMLVIERFLAWVVPSSLGPRLAGGAGRIAMIAVTFHATCLGWLLFRAPNLRIAQSIVANAFSASTDRLTTIMPMDQVWLAVAGILAVIVVDVLAERGLAPAFARVPLPLRWATYYALIFLIVLFPGSDEIRTFIYFQF